MNIVTVVSLWIILTVKKLLPAKASEENDYNIQEYSPYECNTSPMHLAVGLVHVLIEQGEDLEAVDCQGKTPVDLAVEGNVDKFFPRILEHLQTNHKGKLISSNCSSTPLHDAIHSLSRLVRRGDSLNIQNCQGLTPIDVARASENIVVLSLHKRKTDSLKEPPQECNRTLLHSAVLKNDTWKINELLINKEDLYKTDCEGMTPMDSAIVENNEEIIIALAEGQYDVNRKFKDQSLLNRAVTEGSLPIIKLLLHLGTNNNIKDDLLIQAIESRKTDIAQLFIDNGAKLKRQSENGETCVHHFTKDGNVRGLLELKKLNLLTAILVDSPNKKDETPLFLAVKNNYPAIMNILISSGADSKKTLKSGKTYLHIAVQYRSRDALRTLLEIGLPIDTKDDNDVSPIMNAIQNDDTETMDILNEFGSDLQQRSKNESSLLHAAAIGGSTEAVRWLLNHGLLVDEKNNEDFTALHQAARFGKESVVKELLSRNANANTVTKYNETPLHWAAYNGDLQSVQHLISGGADVNFQQKLLWTPLHVAVFHGHLPVLKELVLNGAELNKINKSGHTPLYYAIDRNHHDIKNYLLSKGGKNI